jgi:hypothetical protein
MATTSVTVSIESTAIDALRDEGETDIQVVTRVLHTAAKPILLGIERAAEKAKVDFAALDAAEQTARDNRAAAFATAEATADAAVATKLGV